MSLDSHGARLTQRDVRELDLASTQLAAAVDTIRQAGPKWAEAVVANLYAANLVIVRIQEKGAKTFARYLAKYGLREPQDVNQPTSAAESTDQAPIARPEPEES